MKKYKRYTNDELIQILKNKAEELGRTPTLKDMQIPSQVPFLSTFGTWNNALKKAGLSINRERKEYTEEEIVSTIKQWSKDKGVTPSVVDIESIEGLPTVTNILNKFNMTWNEFVRFLDLEPNVEKDIVTESNEELLDMYVEFSKNLGRPASARDLNRSEEIYNVSAFIIRFGSLENLKKKAGFEYSIRKKKYTKEIIEEILIIEYRKIGRRLTSKEIDKKSNLPSASTVCSYFKTTKISQVWDEIEKSMK